MPLALAKSMNPVPIKKVSTFSELIDFMLYLEPIWFDLGSLWCCGVSIKTVAGVSLFRFWWRAGHSLPGRSAGGSQ